ncbi:MAG: DUF4412 domain-containing protein [Bacteroidota bacterium]
MVKKVVAIMFFLMLEQALFAGWVIIQKNTDPKGVVINETIYLQKNILKQVSKNITIIFDVNLQKITLISDEKKVFFTGTTKDFKAEVIKIANVKFQEMIKNASADKKASYEAAFKEQMKAYDSPSNDKNASKVVVKLTKEVISVLSFKASKYQVFVNDKLKMDIWLSDKFITNVEFDVGKFLKLSGDLNLLTKNKYKASEEYIKMMKKGYALKTIEYASKGNTEIQVVSSVQKNLNAADLGIPAGYKKAALGEILNEQLKF